MYEYSLSLRLRQHRSVHDAQGEKTYREQYHVGPQQLVDAPFPTESFKTKTCHALSKSYRPRRFDRKKVTPTNVYYCYCCVQGRTERVGGGSVCAYIYFVTAHIII